MSDEITDPIAALRHELSSVVPSPEFAAHVRQRLADDLEPLRAELEHLTPSPEFAVRVRQSIEDGRSPGFSWSAWNWRWMVPVSGLAAAAIISMILFRPAQAPAPVLVADVRPSAPETANPGVPPQPGPVKEVTRAPRTPERVASAPLQTVVRAPRDPMLEVITDQPALVQALWARLASEAALSRTGIDSVESAEEITVRAIEVNPVAVKWMVGASAAAAGLGLAADYQKSRQRY